MKIRIILFSIIALFIYSCKNVHSKSSHVGNDTTEIGIIIAKPEVTVLADLPDSLQPKRILFKDRPKPKVIDVSSVPTVTKSLPLLVKKDPADWKDDENKSFILGEGGVSHFTHYSTADGLPSDNVITSFEDSKGNIWFGVAGGVSSFDGQHFTNFTREDGLPMPAALQIAEDKNGNIWFAGTNYLSRFNGKRFTNFKMPGEPPESWIGPMIIDRAGFIWFASGHGLHKFDPSSKIKNSDSPGHIIAHYTTKQGLAGNYISCIYQDHEGEMWVGTDSGVTRFDGQHFTNIGTKEGLKYGAVQSIFQDHLGRFWFGCHSGGLIRYDGSHFESFSSKEGYPDHDGWSIIEDHKGNIWAANHYGITRYDGQHFVTYTSFQSGTGRFVERIIGDRTGRIWIITSGGGVYRFDGNAFTSFSTNQGLPDNNVNTILEDNNGNHWFGTNAGISKFDGNSFTTYSGINGNNNQYTNQISNSFEDSKGNFWFVPDFGFTQFDGKHFTTYNAAQGIDSLGVIDKIVEDKTGALWLARWAGISRLDTTGLTFYTVKQGLQNSGVTGLVNDHDGHLWMSYLNGYIGYFEGKRIINLKIGQRPNTIVVDVAEDRNGNLWFATFDGLVCLSRKEKKKIEDGDRSQQGVIFKNFTTADGLPDNNVQQILPLQNGKIAIGTLRGITIFDAPADSVSNFNRLNHIEIFNESTGCPLKDVHTLYRDREGIIWAASSSAQTGLVRFDYNALFRNKELPKVSIQQVKINDNFVPWNLLVTAKNDTAKFDDVSADAVEELQLFKKVLSGKEADSIRSKYRQLHFDSVSNGYMVPQNLTLPYQFNKITIDFGTHELAHPNLVVYQYKLDGYDKDWSPATKTPVPPTVIYVKANTLLELKHGKGLTEGNAGNWTEPISYSFKVLPPWYRSWWAYASYIIILFVLAGYLFLSI